MEIIEKYRLFFFVLENNVYICNRFLRHNYYKLYNKIKNEHFYKRYY